MRSLGWLTVFVSDTGMAPVEERELSGSRQPDMENPGSHCMRPGPWSHGFNTRNVWG